MCALEFGLAVFVMRSFYFHAVFLCVVTRVRRARVTGAQLRGALSQGSMSIYGANSYQRARGVGSDSWRVSGFSDFCSRPSDRCG